MSREAAEAAALDVRRALEDEAAANAAPTGAEAISSPEILTDAENAVKMQREAEAEVEAEVVARTAADTQAVADAPTAAPPVPSSDSTILPPSAAPEATPEATPEAAPEAAPVAPAGARVSKAKHMTASQLRKALLARGETVPDGASREVHMLHATPHVLWTTCHVLYVAFHAHVHHAAGATCHASHGMHDAACAGAAGSVGRYTFRGEQCSAEC